MKQRLPRISVVTPSFNQAEYVEETLQSVLNQQYPQLEYIVMDGGSHDGSVEIIKKYQKHLKYWQSEPDKGQFDAINQGFARSSGEIMAWLNSDDLFLPHTLQLVGEIFAANPDIEWLTGQQVIIDQYGHPIKTSLPYGRRQAWIARGWHHGRGLGFLGQESTFWRRSLWEKAGGKVSPLHYAVDYELWKRFAQHAEVTSVRAPLGAFRLNPNRKTHHLDPYYTEIGTCLPNTVRFFTLPLKVIIGSILLYNQDRIEVNPSTYTWQRESGLHIF